MSNRTPQRTRYLGDPSRDIRSSKQFSPSNRGIISSSSRPADTRSSKRYQGISDSSSDYDPLTIDSNSQELTGYFPCDSRSHENFNIYDKKHPLINGSWQHPQSQRIPIHQQENSSFACNQQRVSRKNSQKSLGMRLSHRQSRHETDETLDFTCSPINSQLMSYEANNSSVFKMQNEQTNLKPNTSGSASQRYQKAHNDFRKQAHNKENIGRQSKEQTFLKRAKSQPRRHSLKSDKAAANSFKLKENNLLQCRKSIDSESECLSATFRAQSDNASVPTTDRSEKTKINSISTISSHETRQQGLASFIQSNLQNVTRCKIHNQVYTLFNPVTRQFACIECVYSQQPHCKKQQSYISLRNAFPVITEQNRAYKNETKENIKLLDDNFNNCQTSIKMIKHNLEYMTNLVNKEFQILQEELVARKKHLIEAVKTISFNRINELEAKAEDLNFLRGCFKDARDVDPFQNFELGIHFFAVFNFLRNSFKNYDYRTEVPCKESLRFLEFPNRAEAHVLLANYGRVNTTQKSSKIPLKRSASFANVPSNTPPTSSRSKQGNSSATSKSNSPGIRVIKVTAAANLKSQSIPKQRHSFSNEVQKPVSDSLNISFEQHNKSSTVLSHRAVNSIHIDDHIPVKDHKSSQFLSPTHQESTGNRFFNSVFEENRFEPRTPPRDLDFGPKNQDSTISNHSQQQQERITYQERLTATPNRHFICNEQKIQSDDCQYFLEGSIITLNVPELSTVLPPNFRSAQLLYRMSQDGAGSEIFHAKVDDISPLLVFVKANTDYIFGYYVPITFKKEDKYVSCDKSYLFSLKNPELRTPMIFPLKLDKKFIAIFQSSKSPCLGSTLHQKQDLWIQ